MSQKSNSSLSFPRKRESIFTCHSELSEESIFSLSFPRKRESTFTCHSERSEESISSLSFPLKRESVLTNILFIVIILLTFLSGGNLFSATQDSSSQSPLMMTKPMEKILLAKITFGRFIDSSVSESKVEAALSLASELSGKFKLIPGELRDSAVAELKQQQAVTSAMAVAGKLNADKIFVVTLNRLQNILRVDISCIQVSSPEVKLHGKGYAHLHYFKEAGDNPVYDPMILAAMQRALADCVGDSLLYEHASGPFRVFPTSSMVVGAIEFVEDSKFPEWEIFSKKVIMSYDLIESVFEEAKNCQDYAVYDVGTRDSMFAMFGYRLVENYRPPAIEELKMYEKFEVKYYISGLIRRVAQGAELELYLSYVDYNKLSIIRKEKGLLQDDNIDALRSLARSLTKRLLMLNSE
ncbi:MAG: hypothetical protein WCT77_11450 [Bacteroidota bacterium]